MSLFSVRSRIMTEMLGGASGVFLSVNFPNSDSYAEIGKFRFDGRVRLTTISMWKEFVPFSEWE